MARMFSYPSPKPSRRPGRRFCTKMSASFAMPRTMSAPSGRFMSMTTLRLLRPMLRNVADSPATNGGPERRTSSPPSGFSILMTSAPMSPKSMEQNGPAMICVTSMTRTPVSGCTAGLSPHNGRCIRRPVRALMPTASVNSMYRTPCAKVTCSISRPSRMAATNSAAMSYTI